MADPTEHIALEVSQPIIYISGYGVSRFSLDLLSPFSLTVFTLAISQEQMHVVSTSSFHLSLPLPQFLE
jgi:hypothetical protein